MKYSLIDRSEYSKVSKYLDDAYYCVEAFNPVTEAEFDLAYDVLEEKYTKIGSLCDQGDFTSEADFVTDRHAIDASRRLYVHSKLFRPVVIQCALEIFGELKGGFIVIILGIGYTITVVSDENILVYRHEKSTRVKQEISQYFGGI